MAFSTFTLLCNHPLYPVPEHSTAPKENSGPTKQLLPILPAPISCPLPACFLFLWNYQFWIFHINGGPTICDLLCLTSFTEHNTFKVHPCWSMYSISFLLMAEWYSIECIYHNLFIHSSADGHLSCFHLLAIVNSATLNMCVHVIIWVPVLNSLGYRPRSGVAGLYDNSMFKILRNCQTIFHRCGTIWQSITMYEGSNFSTSLPTLVILCFCFFLKLL